MATRTAECSCGQLRLDAEGDPIRVSVCHCLACQRRTGSAFGVQARFPSERVRVSGRDSDHVRISDDGEERTFHFCPECGATVFYTTADAPDVIAVPVGAFADPAFPPPTIASYESRRHPWVELPAEIETDAAWEALRPLYEAGFYAEVADRARPLIEAHPEHAELVYNVACCESLAGRADEAIAHLRSAIERAEQLRSLAARDADFDPIRGQAAFQRLVASARGAA